MRKGQIMTGTMMWIAGLAIAGMTAFFNLKSDQAVLGERENNHYDEVQKQLADVKTALGSSNEKLDALLLKQGISLDKIQTKK